MFLRLYRYRRGMPIRKRRIRKMQFRQFCPGQPVQIRLGGKLGMPLGLGPWRLLQGRFCVRGIQLQVWLLALVGWVTWSLFC
jgi:hypothetical protein